MKLISSRTPKFAIFGPIYFVILGHKIVNTSAAMLMFVLFYTLYYEEQKNMHCGVDNMPCSDSVWFTYIFLKSIAFFSVSLIWFRTDLWKNGSLKPSWPPNTNKLALALGPLVVICDLTIHIAVLLNAVNLVLKLIYICITKHLHRSLRISNTCWNEKKSKWKKTYIWYKKIVCIYIYIYIHNSYCSMEFFCIRVEIITGCRLKFSVRKTYWTPWSCQLQSLDPTRNDSFARLLCSRAHSSYITVTRFYIRYDTVNIKVPSIWTIISPSVSKLTYIFHLNRLESQVIHDTYSKHNTSTPDPFSYS